MLVFLLIPSFGLSNVYRKMDLEKDLDNKYKKARLSI